MQNVFIEFLSDDNKKVMININHITAIQEIKSKKPVEDGNGKIIEQIKVTSIIISGGYNIFVRATYKEVIELIKRVVKQGV